MRRRIAACAVLALAAAAVMSSGPDRSTASASSGNNGEFIIRCLMTGEVQPIDPILAAGGTATHTHMFFGNTNVQATSTAGQMRSHGTACQESKDTAAYWAPQSFMGGTPLLPGCAPRQDGSGNYSCGTDPNRTIYVRAYYLTGAGPNTEELPPGLIMVAGTPDATAPPTNENGIYWDCGANPKAQTPKSIWPYDCSLFQQDQNFPAKEQEGLTEVVDFPSCWDGNTSYRSPNGTNMVAGYFDPSMHRGTGDLAYPPCGGSYTHHVPHVSVRIHYTGTYTVSNDTKTVYPSSCAAASGLYPETCETEAQAYPGQSGPPTDIGLQLSSTQTNGAPGPWYTEHADYWQTWHQGSAPPSTSSAPGTLNSLTYYCLDHANTCGFITNSNYPPPPY